MAKLPKRSTNVSIDPDLLARARALDINLSRALEEKLAELVEKETREGWLKRNRSAIGAYNARVSTEGILSDDGPLF